MSMAPGQIEAMICRSERFVMVPKRSYGYFSAMSRYFQLYGRSPRREFWLFQLAFVIVSISALTLDYQILPFIVSEDILVLLAGFVSIFQSVPGLTIPVFDPSREILFTLSMVVHVIPGLTVAIRRMHDIGMSGWWLLLITVPFFGWIIFVFWMVRKSQDGSSIHGSNPYSSVR